MAAASSPGTAPDLNLPPIILPPPHTAPNQQGKWPAWYCQTVLPSLPHRYSQYEMPPPSPHCQMPPAGAVPATGQCIDATMSDTADTCGLPPESAVSDIVASIH